MDPRRLPVALLMLLPLAPGASAQDAQPAPAPARPAANAPAEPAAKAPAKDVDPLALDVLRYVAQPVEKAQAFSFKALVAEEQLASNGQIVTFFHTVDVSVRRPDKVHLIFRGRGERVDFLATDGNLTMYSPATKLYVSLPAKKTIDANLADLYAKGVDVPIGPFLRSNFYDLAAKTTLTGYVVGRVKLFDQDVHQLAFTTRDADWQLWVTGGATPRFVRAEIVNTQLEGRPRTTIQFLDWNLAPAFAADEFTFAKPADAVQIGFMADAGGN